MENTNFIFDLKTVYLKNSTFEAFHSPRIFFEKIEITNSMNVGIEYMKVGTNEQSNFWEVSINFIVESREKGSEELAYHTKIKMAGLFEIGNQIEEEELEQICRVHCANMIFPYVRQEIQACISSSGFPAVIIKPVNFSEIYKSYLSAKKDEKTQNEESSEQKDNKKTEDSEEV